MKLVRYLASGSPRVGFVDGDAIVDVTAVLGFETMAAVIAAGRSGLAAIQQACTGSPTSVTLAAAQLLAPVERPGKYLAIGMNYAKHLEEADRLGVARSKHQTWSTSRQRASPARSTRSTRA